MGSRKESFKKWGFTKNPFPKQTPTEASIRRLVFTGRSAELERILDAAMTGEPCCLYGTYGIGKTLLMQESARILAEEHSGVLPIYTRFLPEKTFDEIVLEAIAQQLKIRGIGTSVNMKPEKPLSTIGSLLEEARSGDLRVFMLVDDLDRTQDLHDIKSVIDSIRELRDLGCAVCVPANPNNATHSFGTAAQHILDPIKIGRLNADEYLEMAARYLNAEREVSVRIAATHISSPRVFLSYAREDHERVRVLYEQLKSLGFEPWLDTVSLFPGERWEITLESAVRQSEFVVFCITERSGTKRGYLREEMHLALDLARRYLPEDIYIIPVKLEVCNQPPELKQYQWLDLTDGNAIARLEVSLREGMRRRGAFETQSADISLSLDNVAPFNSATIRAIVERVGVQVLTPRSFNTACRELLNLAGDYSRDEIDQTFLDSNWQTIGARILASEGDIERVAVLLKELLRHDSRIDEETIDLDSLLRMLNENAGTFDNLIEEIERFDDIFVVDHVQGSRMVAVSPLIDHDFVRDVFLQTNTDDFRQRHRQEEDDDDGMTPGLFRFDGPNPMYH